MNLPRYLTTEKAVGETPLEALERTRRESGIPLSVPLAYAGRLDPMASGQLLILVGEECKRQERYHSLDKEYEFQVLLGIGSDTHDVLGIVSRGTPVALQNEMLTNVLKTLRGTVTFPYPHFSAKTVHGKPLHTWTLEGKLDEITVPMRTSRIFSLSLLSMSTLSAHELRKTITAKIARVPEVTDARKALGRDFRRDDVLASWDRVMSLYPEAEYTVLSLCAIASSGTYMRTLAHAIGERLGTSALAYSIHRTRIGVYVPVPLFGGFFLKTF